MNENYFILVKQNMLDMLKHSKSEFNKFENERKQIYLQQAGEKLFNTIENYISLINRLRIESFYEAKQLVIKDKSLQKLLFDARELHRFFYHGINEFNVGYIEDLYKNVLDRTEDRIKRL